jgi:hypothetical protein
MGLMSVRRLSLASVVSLCAFTGCVLFSVPEALAVTSPVVEEEAVTNVAGTSATLQAKIDPEGSETTYRFEYGTSAAYGSSIPVPDGLAGSGSVGVTVSAHPQDLLPSTEYHYRVVALVASRSETVLGSDGTFTTQPAGSEFALPDGRQWELVSPPNKRGALIQQLGSGGPIQASEDGGGIAYETNVPTELEPQGYTILTQVLSERGAQGWSSRDIASQHSSPTSPILPPEYRFFSRDLSSSLAYPEGKDGTLLSGQASEPTPYIRREALCDAPASASECYLPVLTGKEGFGDVPPGTKFYEAGQVPFDGASPDLSHVLVGSRVALTETPTTTNLQVYEWSSTPAGGALQLVSVLPASEGGGPAGHNSDVGGSPGFPLSGGRHAVSDDGSRIFWVSELPTGYALYMRDTVKGETVRLDMPQAGMPSGGTPFSYFQIASSDGSRVFFTDFDQEQRLTPQSGTTGQDLYECEIVEEAGKLKCRLTDLTPESGGRSAEVRRKVLGASEDGSYVYFVANGVLGDGAERGAQQGSCGSSSATCNLYEYHDGAVTFITALSAADETDWGYDAGASFSVGPLTARVSPDGRYLAFMSERSLTGYDNRDANSGKPDMEVYLYDAMAGRLMCASCNPTGSRPTGVEAGDFVRSGSKEPRPNLVAVDFNYGEAYNNETGIAANLPPGDSIEHGALYQPRALSNWRPAVLQQQRCACAAGCERSGGCVRVRAGRDGWL